MIEEAMKFAGDAVMSDKSPDVIMPSSLTAENGAKALLIGEFAETIEVRNELYCGCGYCDFCEENPDEPETCQISVPVSWNTIKAIYAKAVQHLSKPLPTDRDDPLRCPECGECGR